MINLCEGQLSLTARKGFLQGTLLTRVFLFVFLVERSETQCWIPA